MSLPSTCDTASRSRRLLAHTVAREGGAFWAGIRADTVGSMTKWEYLTAPVLVHATKQILDNFGQDGWELVQIVPGMNPENLVAYFKRPVA